MPVTRISSEDSEETKKLKLKEIGEARRSLKATREAIERRFGGPDADH